MKYLNLLILTYLLIASLGGSCIAQSRDDVTLTFREDRQYYIIEYWDDVDSAFVKGTFLIGNQIIPKINAGINFIEESDRYEYLYELINQIHSPKPIYLFKISIDTFVEAKSPNKDWITGYLPRENSISWAKVGGDIPGIISGDSLKFFQLVHKNLPKIGPVELSNYAWSSFPNEGPVGKAFQVVDSLRKNNNSIKLNTIIPNEDIGIISSLTSFTDTLETYRQRSCQELGWANDPAVCSQLEEDLNQVRSNLAAGDSLAAAGALQDFINLVQAEKDASLSSEGYALLFFNADYLADRLPEPEDEEPAGGFAIPELPAALTISSASASGAFSADNFSITGAGHDLSGSPDGGSAVHGIVTTTASARQGITGGLQSFQQDNITGSGSQPDVVQQNLSFDPQALIDSVLAGVQQTIPVNASGTFGSAQAPVILHAAQGIQSSATVTGTGILLIDGPFFVSGNFNWTGLVIHRGSPFSGPALSVSTSLQITGAMLTVNEGPWPASIQVSNIFELRYSGPALQLLRDSLTPQN